MRALVIVVLASVLATNACGPSAPLIPQDRIERIRRELDLVVPCRLLDAAFVLDGGSAISGFVDSRGESLWILIDGRMGKGDGPYERHVHLSRSVGWNRRTPGSFDVQWETARRLEFESAPESAAVDLFEWMIRFLVTAEEESALSADGPGPSLRYRSRQEQALILRSMIQTVERNRWFSRGIRHPSRAAIREHLGLEMPVRLAFAGTVDDGGSAVIEGVDAFGESLHVFRDGSLVLVPPDEETEFKSPPRFTTLNGLPGTAGARRLESNSPAESTLVDLLDWLARTPGADPSQVEWVRNVAEGMRRARSAK